MGSGAPLKDWSVPALGLLLTFLARPGSMLHFYLARSDHPWDFGGPGPEHLDHLLPALRLVRIPLLVQPKLKKSKICLVLTRPSTAASC